MARVSYNLMQVNGEQILSGMKIEKDQYTNYMPVFEFVNETSFRGILEHTDRYPENAFLYQVKKSILENTPSMEASWNENSLKQSVIFVDFSEVFRRNKQKQDEFELINKMVQSGQITLTKEEWKNVSDDCKCYWLFQKGLRVRFLDGSVKVFMPFDKSNSMARECRMLFIDEAILPAVNRRLMLGFDFSEMEIYTNLSKLYAYRGLYLTNATRVDQDEELCLNHETIVVLRDDNARIIKNREVITGKLSNDMIDFSATSTWMEERKEQLIKQELTRFDGEGLISPRYAAVLNTKLKAAGAIRNGKDHAASFQIRMPFIKGVLHEVDFHGFIEEQLSFAGLDQSSIQSLVIQDVFGEYRDLSKAEIILTESMFKCMGWLWGKKGDHYQILCSQCDVDQDLMKEFFRRIRRFDHALYIANTDCNLSRNYIFEKEYFPRRSYIADPDYRLIRANTIKMNYQFLHTLKMDAEKFETLVETHLRNSHNILMDTQELMARVLDFNAAMEMDESESDEAQEQKEGSLETSNINMTTWQTALAYNPDFVRHPKIYGELKEVEKSLIKDVGLGRIEVDGCQMFLSQDLLALMIHVINQLRVQSEGADVQKFEKAIQKLTNPGLKLKASESQKSESQRAESDGLKKKQSQKTESRAEGAKGSLLRLRLRPDEFYTADEAALKSALEVPEHLKGYYGLLRNPHLSRNEQCMLKAFEAANPDSARNRIYRKYFGHLQGVLMIAYDSLAALTLGGADFDGDIVKLITNPIVNQAIVDGAYCNPVSERLTENYSLPIVDIPGGAKGSARKISEKMDYTTIRNSFAGRVGEISNFAFRVGRAHYYEESPCGLSADELTNPAFCTILTGLEIDAAKTGIRPKLPTEMAKLKNVKDYFLENKECAAKIKKMKKIKLSSYEVIKDDKKQVYRLTRKKNAGSSIMTADIIDKSQNSKRANVDYLPYYFLREWADLQENAPTVRTTVKNHYFSFETEGWTKQLDQHLIEQVMHLIRAYDKIDRISSDFYKENQKRMETNYYGNIRNILNIQYGNQNARLSTGMTVEDALDLTYKQLMELYCSPEQFIGALERLTEEQWQLAGGFEQTVEKKLFARKELLKKILGAHWLSEDVVQLLINFDHNGYYLLYYILMDIRCMIEMESLPEELLPEEFYAEEKESDQYMAYMEEFYGIYRQAIAEKESKTNWMKKIQKKCRQHLTEIFDTEHTNGMADAVKYTYAKCKTGKFFWEVFESEDIRGFISDGAGSFL